MACVDAGVVDEHVDPAEGPDDLRNHAADRIGITDVGADHQVPATLESGDSLLRGSLVNAVVHCNRPAQGRHASGDRRADASGRAGDEHGATGEVDHRGAGYDGGGTPEARGREPRQPETVDRRRSLLVGALCVTGDGASGC
jgi:hypothetical protein